MSIWVRPRLISDTVNTIQLQKKNEKAKKTVKIGLEVMKHYSTYRVYEKTKKHFFSFMFKANRRLKIVKIQLLLDANKQQYARIMLYEPF